MTTKQQELADLHAVLLWMAETTEEFTRKGNRAPARFLDVADDALRRLRELRKDGGVPELTPQRGRTVRNPLPAA